MDFDQNRAGPRKGSVALEKIGGPPVLTNDGDDVCEFDIISGERRGHG